ncbi:hypothetical protein ASPCADRAFT_127995 [Aspergillus carbonarius ITEM 5010]|uniref:Zn(2)-C6 fungal-type domain-containing protein n=1 Tax=Aspergillus carbonarius (strain ITEM 5010) TaxID=602072 RepID=A0A1R3RTH6_ASPC5|nr:hypothetical protein ASPCADRAFT_127995 [Aspergillus carbonarius ITEM 5010]
MSTRSQGCPVDRQKVTTACVSCRSSKVKCDANLPSCRRCEKKGRDCVYPFQDDKRRVPLKGALEVFIKRVRQLEIHLSQHAIPSPAIEMEDREVFKMYMAEWEFSTHVPEVAYDLCETVSTFRNASTTFSRPLQDYHIPEYDLHLMNSGNSIPPPTCGQNAEELRADMMTGDILDGMSSESQSEFLTSFPENMTLIHSIIPRDDLTAYNLASCHVDSARLNNSAHASDSRLNYESEVFIDDNDMVSELSNRMGRLHLMHDGQLRYFGATSNFNLVTDSMQQNLLMGLRPGLGPVFLEDEIDFDTETHLERLFFCWHDPTCHVVDESMYYHSKALWANEQEQNTFYSPLLNKAICAIGALFDSQLPRPRQRADTFAKMAKALLENELESPKVATVQALVILSSFEAGATRESRAWLFSGMAMRLAFDLGLHTNMNAHISEGKLSPPEGNARRAAFWGSYINDHLWALYLGRPFQNGGNITVSKPESDEPGQEARWAPYISCQNHLKSPPDTELGNPIHVITRQWVYLCESQNEWGDTLSV